MKGARFVNKWLGMEIRIAGTKGCPWNGYTCSEAAENVQKRVSLE